MDNESKRGQLEIFSNMISGYRAPLIIFAAHSTGIFSELGTSRYSAEQISKNLRLDERAVEIVLDSLVALNLLIKRKMLYENSQMAKTYLLPDSPDYRGDMVNHSRHLINSWMNIGSILKEGSDVLPAKKKKSPEELRDFIMAMANVGLESINLMLGEIDFSVFNFVLDLGGGPGTYLSVLCSNYPELKAVLFDLPDVIDIAKENLDSLDINDRISFIKGDFLIDEIGSGYDCIIVSNIIHSLGPEQIKNIIYKSYNALDSGGKILIKDFFLEENRTKPSAGAVFAVNMLVNTEDGRSYTWEEVSGWMKDAGFCKMERCVLTEHSGVLTGTKP